MCVRNRSCLFDEVSNGEVKLNDAARLVQAAWNELPKRFAKLEIDKFIVMPNHIHGILIVGAHSLRPLHYGTTTTMQNRAR
jgi:putative transposase